MKRILYVEDHAAFREALTRVLLDWGYEVESACCFAEAMRSARASSYCLDLIDAGLPDGSGVELCRQIRIFDSSTPIVIYSISESFGAEALEAGAQAFIVKGEDLIDDLYQTFSRLLACG